MCTDGLLSSLVLICTSSFSKGKYSRKCGYCVIVCGEVENIKYRLYLFMVMKHGPFPFSFVKTLKAIVFEWTKIRLMQSRYIVKAVFVYMVFFCVLGISSWNLPLPFPFHFFRKE
ncbi:unnamed protein product [Orchesella dallaii]|uniref:Uncharacterized protein n=1 Tax=Orchesella dallaii TaxID=48710 RepID=A0ABP1S3F4_9HEXA